MNDVMNKFNNILKDKNIDIGKILNDDESSSENSNSFDFDFDLNN